MKELDLSEKTIDWFLPKQHERVWWSQFLQGGRTFLDVGAHVGTWTLNIGHKFERVFCFEPDERAAEGLRENLERAQMRHVEVIMAAVGNRTGMVELTRYPNPCTNTMFPDATGRGHDPGDIPHDRQMVPILTLDQFCADRGIDDVDFVKIDTEGAECQVLQGAQAMWRKNRPDFFVEMHGPFHRECRALLDFEECDLIDMCGWGFSMVRHRESWSMGPDQHYIYPHGTDATDEALLRPGGRERWIQFRPVMG